MTISEKVASVHSALSLEPLLLFGALILGCGHGAVSVDGNIPPPALPPTSPVPRATYYVNCSVSSNGNGTKASPWNSLSSVNAATLTSGNSVLFARGTTCNGELIPEGSGTSASVVTVDAYGTGALPIIDGGVNNPYALYLNDVEYSQINNLTIRGSNSWALFVTGSTPGRTLHHIHLANLDVSGVNFVSKTREDSGLVDVNPACNELMDDVLLDGIVAHDTTAAEGINSNGAGWCPTGTAQTLSGPVTVQNSTVHDVYADGIIVADGENMLVQNDVVYNTGKCPVCTASTPGGIWDWGTDNAIIQNNESYLNHTWLVGHDGGDFDIDTPTANSTYQYNYGHDSDGYCISVLGAIVGAPTPNSIVRYNICANNVQVDSNYGEIFLYTWDNGTLDGVQVYNNTIYLNPGVTSAYALVDGAAYAGTTPNFFMNNLIYSVVPNMILATTNVALDNNLYFNATGTGYNFTYGGSTYSGFSAYQVGSGQDGKGVNADPLLKGAGYHSRGNPNLSNGNYTLQTGSPATGAGANVCAATSSCIGGSMGTQDFFGQTLTSTHNIGAYD